MAIGYLNVAIVGRTTGASSVHAAAYASRADLTDERTGITYRYSDKASDVVASWVWLPKNAPDSLRDRGALWNAVEKAETRRNSQLARRMIVALPHELNAKQQEQLLKDFVRENFTRKGLAADVSIHQPHQEGDQRNDHAHILIPTRFFDKEGLARKDRESNSREVFQAWRADWAKKANYQLERHGHAARVGFDVPDGQEPQVHMGQAATALERKGMATRVGDMLRQIVNDNDRRRAVANDLQPGDRKEIYEPEPVTIDRDEQNVEWQDSVDQAGIDEVEAQRQTFYAAQVAEREEFDQHGKEMEARHSFEWNAVLERYNDTGASYQHGEVEDAVEATAGAASFFLSLFTSWAEGIARSITGSRPQTQPKLPRGQVKKQEQERQRKVEQQQEARSRELEAIMQEQSREREAYERRRALMLFQQAGAMQNFEQEIADRSAMPRDFDRKRTVQPDPVRRIVRAERPADRKGQDRGGPGLELG